MLPLTPGIIVSCTGQPHPLVSAGQLRLIAWRLSGRASARKAFWSKLCDSYSVAPDAVRTRLTNLHGPDGVVGVVNGVSIPYVQL